MLLNGAHPCYHVYRCADGWITVAALEPKFWARLCELLDVEELRDLAFATGAEADGAVQRLERCVRERDARAVARAARR